MTEQKLKELLADMTLEEKVNQMSQVVGAFFNKDMDITAMGPMADKGFTPENVALSGSILGSMGAETLKKIQKDFVEQHPPHLFLSSHDGSNHYNYTRLLAWLHQFEPDVASNHRQTTKRSDLAPIATNQTIAKKE